MSYRLVTEDILSVAADAAVLGVEMTMRRLMQIYEEIG